MFQAAQIPCPHCSNLGAPLCGNGQVLRPETLDWYRAFKQAEAAGAAVLPRSPPGPDTMPCPVCAGRATVTRLTRELRLLATLDLMRGCQLDG